MAARAILYRWSELNKKWEEKYTVQTTDEKIKEKIARSLTEVSVEKCYKWECFDSDGHPKGVINTANQNLF